MKLRLALLGLSVALSGCASLGHRERVSGFVGKPLDALVATYGKPGPGGDHLKGVRAYQWTFAKDYLVANTATSVTSGYVGNQVVSATTSTVSGYTPGRSACILHVDVDAEGTVVRAYHTSDDYCGRYFRD